MQAVFLIQFPVKLLQFYFQMLPRVFRQLCDVPTVQEFIGWFPVWYEPEELIGKNVAIVANLAPRPMMKGKYVSEGMILSL